MNTFTPQERLKSRKLIDGLFESGRSLDAPPLKLKWAIAGPQTPAPVQMGFAVSRKTFKRAVDRNRVKRLMREAWRLQKQPLYDVLAGRQLRLTAMLIFTGRQLPRFSEVADKMAVIIKKLEPCL